MGPWFNDCLLNLPGCFRTDYWRQCLSLRDGRQQNTEENLIVRREFSLFTLFIYFIYFLFFCDATAPVGPRPPHSEVCKTHTIRHTHAYTHTHAVGILWTSDRPVARPLPTQHTQETNLHTLNRIRTRIANNQAAADVDHTVLGWPNQDDSSSWKM